MPLVLDKVSQDELLVETVQDVFEVTFTVVLVLLEPGSQLEVDKVKVKPVACVTVTVLLIPPPLTVMTPERCNPVLAAA